ncbi:hypothetical protein Btru_066695 [Bulinus truncatus]|nr:hypothetical protein Btru_066695 [Bulinus truncatus]
MTITTTKQGDHSHDHHYHQIRSNTGNVKSMCKAIWANLFHSMSTDESPLLQNCPEGSESWCKYNKAITLGLPARKHLPTFCRTFLSPEVGNQLKNIYMYSLDTENRHVELNDATRLLMSNITFHPSDVHHMLKQQQDVELLPRNIYNLKGKIFKPSSDDGRNKRRMKNNSKAIVQVIASDQETETTSKLTLKNNMMQQLQLH